MDLFKPLEYEAPSSKLHIKNRIQSKQNERILSMMHYLREELEEERKINNHLHSEYMRLISKYDQLLSADKQSYDKTHNLFDEYKKLSSENKRLLLDNVDLYFQLQEANDHIGDLELRLSRGNEKCSFSATEDMDDKSNK